VTQPPRATSSSAPWRSQPPAGAIEDLARAAYLNLDFARPIEDWEPAYAAHLAGAESPAEFFDPENIERTMSLAATGP
jgi:hypothetical protein